MISEFGKLIVSTNALNTRKKYLRRALCAILWFFGAVSFALCGTSMNSDRHAPQGSDIKTIFLFVLSVAFVAYGSYLWIATNHISQSYCRVFEHAVTGITFSSSNPLAAPKKFSLPYQQITGVSESENGIIISTNFEQFEICAPANRPEAIREIRNRMTAD